MATIVLRGVKGSPLTNAEVDANFTNLNQELSTKQNILVSGTNIKTINGASIVGSGNLEITVDLAAYADTGLPTIRPSLNLDFANSKTVDPRITFTRASTAGYFDDKGIYRQAAVNQPRIDHDPATGECKGLLIEESRTNNFIYSEDFYAGWVKSNALVSKHAAIAPNGTLSASKITEIGSLFASKGIYKGVVVGTSSAFSVFAKAGERNQLRLHSYESFTPSNPIVATFDLIGGTVLYSLGTTKTSIIPVGNGWFLCSISGSTTATYTTFTIGIGLGANSTYSGNEYMGIDGAGIYIWGAQLEVGSFPTSYIPTPATFTSRASVGTYFDSTGLLKTAAINEPRYDHGLVDGVWVPKGLLLEPQRTNLLTYSEQFDNADWLKIRTSVTANAITAPDGTLTADKLVEDTQTGSHYVYVSYGVSLGNNYSFSVFVKAGERSSIILSSGATSQTICEFNLSTGAVVSAGVNSVAKINPAGNGWYRCSISVVASVGNSATFVIGISPNTGYTGDGTSGIYIWGAQLEEIPAGQSPEPSSYIKTEATAVTRSADVSTSNAVTRAADSAVMTGENFSSWYNRSEGTFYAESSSGMGTVPPGVRAGAFVANHTTKADYISIAKEAGSTRYSHVIDTGGEVQLTGFIGPNTVLPGQKVRLTVSFAQNNAIGSGDGQLSTADFSVKLPDPNRLFIGRGTTAGWSVNGHIAKLAYYPKRLPNNELVQLTSE